MECSGLGVTPGYQMCPAGTKLDAKQLACVQLSSQYGKLKVAGKCANTICPKDTANATPLKANPAFFLLCDQDKVKMVYKCRDEQNTIFDKNLQKCMHNCVQPGNFVNREQCNSYYKCVSKGTKFIVTEHTCPDGFNFVERTCVRGPACTSEL